MKKELYLSALKTGMNKYFGNLDEPSLDALTQKLEWQEVLSGTVLIKAGEATDGMYLLLSGRLSVYQEQADGKSELVGSVFRGESVGEMGLLTDSLRSATVVASRDSVLVKISTKDFQEVSEAQPSILREFAKTVVNRLQQANTHTIRRLKPNITFVPLNFIAVFSSWI
jgi:NTE family protein